MAMKIGGSSFSVYLFDEQIQIKKVTLAIADGRKTNMTGGIPDGEVLGPVSASGEVIIGASQRTTLVTAAKLAGSFEQLPAFDMPFVGVAGKDTFRVVAHGVSISVSDLLNIDTNGDGESEIKLPFEVTSPNFVTIDGVPYLSPKRTRQLVG